MLYLFYDKLAIDNPDCFSRPSSRINFLDVNIREEIFDCKTSHFKNSDVTLLLEKGNEKQKEASTLLYPLSKYSIFCDKKRFPIAFLFFDEANIKMNCSIQTYFSSRYKTKNRN